MELSHIYSAVMLNHTRLLPIYRISWCCPWKFETNLLSSWARTYDPFVQVLACFSFSKITIVQTLKRSACCFLTWLSLAPLELKNNGQWLQGMEPSGIIPCEADMCLLSQNVLHKLWPHISHLLLLCILYLWAFRACGVPKALLHSSHCSGVLFSCFTFINVSSVVEF